MIDSTRIKYINKIVSDIEVELDQREKDMIRDKISRTMNKPERAIAKAVLNQTRRIYMQARRNLLITGLENKSNTQADIFGLKTAEEYEAGHHAHVDEIREIIKYSNLVADTRDNHDKPSLSKTKIEEDQHMAKLHGQTLPATVRTAFETLARYGILSSALDINKFSFIANTIGPVAPRGNPFKGGLVRTLIAQGYSHSDALIEATAILRNEANKTQLSLIDTTSTVEESEIIITPEMQKVMDDLTKPKISKDQQLMDAFMDDEDKKYMAEKAIELIGHITTKPPVGNDLGSLTLSNEDSSVSDF